MNLKELRDLLEKIKEVKVGSYTYKEDFDTLKDLVDEYNYDYDFNDIFDETEALDRIAERCNYGSVKDVYDYINGCYDAELFSEDWGQLHEVDDCEIENIKEDIIEGLNQDIEVQEKQELRDKLQFEIKQFFIENGISIDTEGKIDINKLVDRIINTFEISLKEQENECVRNNE